MVMRSRERKGERRGSVLREKEQWLQVFRFRSTHWYRLTCRLR